MSRYIDADALEKKILKRGAYKICTDDVVAMIADAPTVDAVQVVRCRECKYFKDGMCYNPNTYDDEKTCGNTTADWFCADGERRSDEDQHIYD